VIEKGELFGVTETSATLAFDVSGDGEVRVRLDGEVRATSAGAAGPRQVRVEGLEPGREYALALEAGGRAAPADRWLPERFRTLPAPETACVASFATLNDLHFGETHFGGEFRDGEIADVPGAPIARQHDGPTPYWQLMNEDAIAEINRAGVDCAVIKGDIADRGRPEQFALARAAFAGFEVPCHAFLGNHDHYARLEGEPVDGYALLGQPRAPRALDLGGWRLLLLDTVEPGHHHGVLDGDRLAWIARELGETREAQTPTLLVMHHQPVPPEHAGSYPNSIGIRPEHSLEFYALLGRHPQVRGVLIGHTHRNKVHFHADAGRVPFIEVNCTKDYPGGWAHYRLYADGSFRQEVRRTGSERALAHSSRCRDFFRGMYRVFALGSLEERSFATPGWRG
jgi:hypothetical protein